MNTQNLEVTQPPTARIDLLLIASFLWKYRSHIIGISVLSATLIGTIGILTTEKQFQSTALCVVVPTVTKTELQPTLTVEGCKRILDSESVLDDTRASLAKNRFVSDAWSPVLGKNLESVNFIEGPIDRATYSSMIQISAKGNSPQQANAIANAWVSSFLGKVQSLTSGTTSTSVRFLESQYPEARNKVILKQAEKNQTDLQFQNSLLESNNSWSKKISDYSSQAAEEIAQYQADTNRKLEDLRALLQITTKEKKLEAVRKVYSDLQTEQGNVNATLQRISLELEAAKAQIQSIQQFVTLKKAISDEALWNALTQNGMEDNFDWSKLQNRQLLTQEINPAYQELKKKIISLDMEVNSLKPRSVQLEKELTGLEGILTSTDKQFRLDGSMIEDMKQNREAGLEKLKLSRTMNLEKLKREMNSELETITRERTSEGERQDRDMRQLKALLNTLEKNYNQAILAKAQVDLVDIRLVSPPTTPRRPISSNLIQYPLLGLFAGFFGGLGWAIVLEMKKRGLRF